MKKFSLTVSFLIFVLSAIAEPYSYPKSIVTITKPPGTNEFFQIFSDARSATNAFRVPATKIFLVTDACAIPPNPFGNYYGTPSANFPLTLVNLSNTNLNAVVFQNLFIGASCVTMATPIPVSSRVKILSSDYGTVTLRGYLTTER